MLLHRPQRWFPAALLIFLFAGCEESLPPKNDPLVVVRSGFTVNPGIVEIRNNASTGLPGTFVGSLENTFNEVLQDSQRIVMAVDVRLRADPLQKRHLVFTRNNVSEPQYLNGEILTLEPGKPVHVFGNWSHRTDSDSAYWSFVNLQGPFVTPGAGEVYYQSDTVKIVVEASLQGYKRLAAARLGPFEYSLVYRIF
jgi:hypothetical protein